MIGARFHVRPNGRAEPIAHAGVVALPCACEADVPKSALGGVQEDGPAAIGYVVPHEPTRFGPVHGPGDDEGGDVANMDVSPENSGLTILRLRPRRLLAIQRNPALPPGRFIRSSFATIALSIDGR